MMKITSIVRQEPYETTPLSSLLFILNYHSCNYCVHILLKCSLSRVSFIKLFLFNSLQDLFKGIEIQDVTELALGANLALSDIKKMQWTTADGNIGEKSKYNN